MSELGCDVRYLKRDDPNASSSSRNVLKRTALILARSGFGAAKAYLSSTRDLARAVSELKILEPSASAYEGVDLFALGSDTIWNLRSKYFATNRDRYWGTIFPKGRVVSYAGSLANADESDVDKFPELADAASSWLQLGVRDEHTRSTLAKLTGREPEIVCDPTLLFERDYYEKMIAGESPSVKEPYIFLYLFEPLAEATRASLFDFAKREGLRVVDGRPQIYGSPGKVALAKSSPRAFLRGIASSRYVVTDSFHGAVFSTRFEKPFVSVERGKNKVLDYLTRVGGLSRLVADDAGLAEKLASPPDYASISASIAAFSQSSRDFLRRAVESARRAAGARG